MKRRLSGASLMLLELTLSALIFCLSAAVCANLLARSVTVSRHSEAVTGAVFAAESAAEHFKAAEDLGQLSRALGGRLEGAQLTVCYDDAWMAADEARYRLDLLVSRDPDSGVSRASIRVTDGSSR